jgi:hypothetical protein
VSSSGLATTATATPRLAHEVTLLDLLDRLLEGGIAIQGEITLAVADIDLVDLSLRLVVGSVGSLGRGLNGPLPRGTGLPERTP